MKRFYLANGEINHCELPVEFMHFDSFMSTWYDIWKEKGMAPRDFKDMLEHNFYTIYLADQYRRALKGAD